jgi:hypothetical protein
MGKDARAVSREQRLGARYGDEGRQGPEQAN